MTQLIILKSVVDSILQKNGIENSNQIYHNWKEQGISICEKDRPYKRLKITNALPRQNCLVFEYENTFAQKDKSQNNITFEVSDDCINIF